MRLTLILPVIAVIWHPTAAAIDLDPGKIRADVSESRVSVLQNRFFRKAGRPEIGVVAGKALGEAYTNTVTHGIRAGLFTSEHLGFEIQHLTTTITDTPDREALKALKYRRAEDTDGSQPLVHPDPEFNGVQGMTDIAACYAPFYGKFNLLDRYMVYSDLYLSAGYARVTSPKGQPNALSFGVGQRFYFSDSWSLRLDLRDRMFSERRAGEDTRRHFVTFDFGVSYLWGGER